MAEKSDQAAQASTSAHERGRIENKVPKPAGLLLRNTQQLVILGVATVMILIMWLGGSAKGKRTSKPDPPTEPQFEPANPATVEAFKRSIEQQGPVENHPISQANWKRLQALGLAGDVPPGTSVVPPASASAPEPGSIIGAAAGESSAPPDPIEQDKKKRAYLSLFAPNVAFTYRKDLHTGSASGPAVPPGADGQQPESNSPASAVLPPSAAVAPGEAAHASFFSEESRPSGVPSGQADRGSGASAAVNSFTGKTYVLFEGSIIETVLMNRLDGSFSGPVNCLVTTDLYSHDHQHVLILAGTKVLGEAKKVDAFGQQRLAVFFHRLIMPDGYSVSLDQFKGLSQTGETALRDKVNNHYLEIFGSSLAVGILGGVAEAGTGDVLTNSPLDRTREGLGASLANSSMDILDRFLNILPTITIREGCRVNVYLAGDLFLPDYADHTMSPNL